MQFLRSTVAVRFIAPRTYSWTVTKVQVKTALARQTGKGYSARYSIKYSQLESRTIPETWCVFANRFENRWQLYFVIARQTLYDLHDLYNIGSLNQNGFLSLYFAYTDTTVQCAAQNLSIYPNNWHDWPPIFGDRG